MITPPDLILVNGTIIINEAFVESIEGSILGGADRIVEVASEGEKLLTN